MLGLEVHTCTDSLTHYCLLGLYIHNPSNYSYQIITKVHSRIFIMAIPDILGVKWEYSTHLMEFQIITRHVAHTFMASFTPKGNLEYKIHIISVIN